jgi:hypothetical protein
MKHSLSLRLAFLLKVAGVARSPRTPAPETSSEDSKASEPSSQADLLTYDGRSTGIPVTARHPATIRVEGTGSGEGVGVFFSFDPQGNELDRSSLHVFLPSGASSAAEQEPFVRGTNGLMASNRWVEQEGGGEALRGFSTAGSRRSSTSPPARGQSGHILLGQAHGQAVQVTLLYPPSMADAYWSAATTVLESLEFDADSLPIRRSNP